MLLDLLYRCISVKRQMDVRSNLMLSLEIGILHNEIRDACKYGEYEGKLKLQN